MLKPILSPILRPILSSIFDGTKRWYWNLNGTSYGIIPDAVMGISGTYTETLYLESLPVSAVKVFNTKDGTSYINLSSTGELTVVGDITAKLNDVDILSGVTQLTLLTASTIEVTATAEITISQIPSSSTVLTGYIYNVSATGITNLDTYPSGTFNCKLDEPYSDAHTAVDSDNEDGAESAELAPIFFDGSQGVFSGALVSNNSPLVSTSYRVIMKNSTNGTVRLNYGAISLTLPAGESVDTIGATSGEQTYAPSLQDRTGGIIGTVGISIKKTTSMQKFNDLPEDYTQELL